MNFIQKTLSCQPKEYKQTHMRDVVGIIIPRKN